MSMFLCNKTKTKIERTFASVVCNILKVLIVQKEIQLEINGKQIVELRSGSIKFKNHFEQSAAPFKIYASFESLLNRVRSIDRNNNTSYTEKFQDHIPFSFACKVVCIDDRFSKLLFTKEKMQFIDSLKQFSKNIIIVKM